MVAINYLVSMKTEEKPLPADEAKMMKLFTIYLNEDIDGAIQFYDAQREALESFPQVVLMISVQKIKNHSLRAMESRRRGRVVPGSLRAGCFSEGKI